MIDRSVSDRIAMLRFLMIAGIVVLHTPKYVPLAELGDGYFDFFKAFFQHAFFRTTVPVLTCISGYLVFKANLDQQVGKLYTKKLRSLGIPFLVFNLGLLGVAYLAQAYLGVTTSVDLIPYDANTWLNAAFGWKTSPINYPLNFLRDLLAIILITPLLGYLVRKAPMLGLLLVAVVFFKNFDGLLVLRPDMVVTFYVGALAAVYQWNLTKLDRFASALLVVFVGLCAAMVYFKVANSTYLRLVSPFLVWPAASLLVNTAAGKWCMRMSRYSFFIFVTHSVILLASWMVYQKVQTVVPYALYWFLTPVLTIAVLVVTYRMLMHVFPTITDFALGNKPKPVGLVLPVPDKA